MWSSRYRKWFDKRAVEGNKWVVYSVTQHYYSHTSFDVVELVRYSACPLLDLPNSDMLANVKCIRNDLTKDEAMAMEKFLNFAE